MTGTTSLGRCLVIGLVAASAAGAAQRVRGLPAVEGGGALLRAAVRDARAVALDRIEEHRECRQLFTERGADAAELIENAVYHRAAPGEAGRLCERGVAAFTVMRSGRTALCADSFVKLGRGHGAVVLLHEALHVAGMEEYPHHRDGLTPQQIDRMVKLRCGL